MRDTTLAAILAGIGGGASNLYQHRQKQAEIARQEEEDRQNREEKARQFALNLEVAKRQMAHLDALEAAARQQHIDDINRYGQQDFQRRFDTERDNMTRLGVFPTYESLKSSITQGSLPEDVSNPDPVMGSVFGVLQKSARRGAYTPQEVEAAKATADSRLRTVAMGNKGFVVPDPNKVQAEESRRLAATIRDQDSRRDDVRDLSKQRQDAILAAAKRAGEDFDKTRQGQQLLNFENGDLNDPNIRTQHDNLMTQRQSYIQTVMDQAQHYWDADFLRSSGISWRDFVRQARQPTLGGTPAPHRSSFNFQEWRRGAIQHLGETAADDSTYGGNKRPTFTIDAESLF